MDTLDYVDELKTCIHSSSSTLHKLKLSISDTLANASRKPPPEADPDDSDVEGDDFGNMLGMGPPPPQGDISTEPAQAKEAKMLSERKAQEAMLGRIFGLDPAIVTQGHNKRGGELSPDNSGDEGERKGAGDAGKAFIRDLKALSAKLMTSVHGSNRTQRHREALDVIEQAAKKYVEVQEEVERIRKERKDAAEAEAANGSGSGSGGGSDAKMTPASSSQGVEAKTAPDATEDVEKMEGVSELFKEKNPGTKQKEDGSADPEEIDVDEPEADVEGGTVDVAESAEPSAAPNAGEPALSGWEPYAWPPPESTLEWGLPEDNSQVPGRSSGIASHSADHWASPDNADSADQGISQEELLRIIKNSKKSAAWSTPRDNTANTTATTAASAQMTDYIRTTRGLALHSLSIHLIPIRASLLSRALDLRVLQHLVLLNVGSQTGLWKLLHRENTIEALPLHRIHTDNVTDTFLDTVASLRRVTELFLLERGNRNRVEVTAGKTAVTMDGIRRKVLKRHVGGLKKLMIRNEGGEEWDLDERTVVLLARKGRGIEELAGSLGVRAVVCAFFLHISPYSPLKSCLPLNTRLRTCHPLPAIYPSTIPTTTYESICSHADIASSTSSSSTSLASPPCAPCTSYPSAPMTLVSGSCASCVALPLITWRRIRV